MFSVCVHLCVVCKYIVRECIYVCVCVCLCVSVCMCVRVYARVYICRAISATAMPMWWSEDNSLSSRFFSAPLWDLGVKLRLSGLYLGPTEPTL